MDSSGSSTTTAGGANASSNSSIWGPLPSDTRRSLQPDIIACASITWSIALSFVLLRFYTRGRMIHVLGPSDWCIIPSLIFAGGTCASAIEQAVRGQGNHFWNLNPNQFMPMERAGWYGILFYNLSLAFTKVSILLLYLRVFTYNWARRAILAVLAFVVLFEVWVIVSVCTTCIPLRAYWDWSLFLNRRVFCYPLTVWWLNTALHIATDVVIVLLPMPILSRLRLPRRQRYALVGVFALGLFVCLVSILRLVQLIRLFTHVTMDPTYSGAYLAFWTTVEVNAAISCACIMTLKPFLVRHFPRLLDPASYIRRYARHSSSPVDQGPPHKTTRWPRLRSSTSPRVHEDGWLTQQLRKESQEHPSFESDGNHLEMGLTRADVEAQHSEVSSSRSYNGESNCGGARLNPPPAAHVRLSIQVTKSIHVTSEKAQKARSAPTTPLTTATREKGNDSAAGQG